MDLNGYHLFRPSAWVLAEGEDAHDFLQSQFSNDLRSLAAGESCYGLWLDQKGKVHGDSQVLKLGEEQFYLFSYFTPADTLIEKLERFIVADDVELEDHGGDVVGVSLVGRAVETFGNVDEAEFTGLGVRRFPGRRGMKASLELVVPEENRDALLELLQKDEPMTALDADTMESFRILNRVPRVPRDIGPDELPQEGGLEKDGVSFTKGCYLGQEVMSRLHSMGRVRRTLRLIEVAEPIPFGESLYSNGKKVGVVKTSVEDSDRIIALVLISNTVSEGGVIQVGGAESDRTVTILPSPDG